MVTPEAGRNPYNHREKMSAIRNRLRAKRGLSQPQEIITAPNINEFSAESTTIPRFKNFAHAIIGAEMRALGEVASQYLEAGRLSVLQTDIIEGRPIQRDVRIDYYKAGYPYRAELDNLSMYFSDAESITSFCGMWLEFKNGILDQLRLHSFILPGRVARGVDLDAYRTAFIEMAGADEVLRDFVVPLNNTVVLLHLFSAKPNWRPKLTTWNIQTNVQKGREQEQIFRYNPKVNMFLDVNRLGYTGEQVLAFIREMVNLIPPAEAFTPQKAK